MTLTEYETIVVLRADLGGEAVEAALDKVRDAITARNGKLLAINHWGKKKLAYDIEKQSRGIYVHINYLGSGDLVHEIERNLRISDSVLRFLTVRLADKVDREARTETAYVAPAYDADEPEASEAAEDGERDERDDRDRDDDNDGDERGGHSERSAKNKAQPAAKKEDKTPAEAVEAQS